MQVREDTDGKGANVLILMEKIMNVIIKPNMDKVQVLHIRTS